MISRALLKPSTLNICFGFVWASLHFRGDTSIREVYAYLRDVRVPESSLPSFVSSTWTILESRCSHGRMGFAWQSLSTRSISPEYFSRNLRRWLRRMERRDLDSLSSQQSNSNLARLADTTNLYYGLSFSLSLSLSNSRCCVLCVHFIIFQSSRIGLALLARLRSKSRTLRSRVREPNHRRKLKWFQNEFGFRLHFDLEYLADHRRFSGLFFRTCLRDVLWLRIVNHNYAVSSRIFG